MEHKQIIKGDYVFTPIKNAFNDKTSYWVSKRDHVIAVYAFTPWSDANLRELTADKVLDSYIRMYDEYIKRLTATVKVPGTPIFKSEDDIRMEGIVYKHGNGDMGYWQGFSLSDEEESKIYEVLKEHDTEGCSICGSAKDIAQEINPE